MATENPCPIGTYGNETNLKAEADCAPCLHGWYCDQCKLDHHVNILLVWLNGTFFHFSGKSSLSV